MLNASDFYVFQHTNLNTDKNFLPTTVSLIVQHWNISVWKEACTETLSILDCKIQITYCFYKKKLCLDFYFCHHCLCWTGSAYLSRYSRVIDPEDKFSFPFSLREQLLSSSFVKYRSYPENSSQLAIQRYFLPSMRDVLCHLAVLTLCSNHFPNFSISLLF